MRFGLPRLPPDERSAIELTASGYPWGRGAPTRVIVVVNGRPAAKWRFGPGAPSTVHVPISPDAVEPGGTVTLDLLIANPRQPWRDTEVADVRDLGLYMEAVRLTASPKP